ncbi:MAG: hypothetical protein R3B84_01255 [Zavarzinella sp.]
MRRIKTIIVACGIMAILSGCCGNRPRPILDCLCGKNSASPVVAAPSFQQPIYGAPGGYVSAENCACEGSSMPIGAGLPPGAYIVPPGTGTLPMPKSDDRLPRIPTPGIQETPGKQFELDPTARGVSRMSGPPLLLPSYEMK